MKKVFFSRQNSGVKRYAEAKNRAAPINRGRFPDVTMATVLKRDVYAEYSASFIFITLFVIVSLDGLSVVE